MGELIEVDFRRGKEAPLTKRAMALRLGRSVRWLELRVREGMPSYFEGIRRMFVESEVRAWLAERGPIQ